MPDLKTEAPVVSASDIKKLEERLAKQRDAFKNQSMTAINEHIAALQEIGFEYELVEKGNGAGKKNRCGNCGAEGHSARTCPQPKK